MSYKILQRIPAGNSLPAIMIAHLLTELKRLIDNLPQKSRQPLRLFGWERIPLRIKDELLVIPVVQRGGTVSGKLKHGMRFIGVSPGVNPVRSDIYSVAQVVGLTYLNVRQRRCWRGGGG
jgi:hypothetical protein